MPGEDGQVLRPGDRIRTGKNSAVTITFGDEEIKLAPDTEFVIGGEQEGLLDKLFLEGGRIWLKLKGVKEVTTVSSRAAVRGTEFSVAAVGTTTIVRVYQGSIELSDADRKSSVLINAGYQASVTKGLRPTGPTPIDETDAPQVASVFPSPADRTIDEERPIAIKFTKAIHPESVTASSFKIVDATGAELEGSWNVGVDSVVFKPSKKVEAGTKYTVTIRGGGGGLNDWSGIPLPSDYTWSFTLEKPFLVAGPDTTKEEKYLKEALDYIEGQRKGEVTLSLLDATTNKPIPGASITYEQKSRDFILGPMWLDMWRPERERQPTKEIFTGAWTTLTAGMGAEWTTVEPTKGVFNFAPGDQLVSTVEREYPGTQWVFMFYDLTLNAYGGRPPAHAQFDGIADSRVFQEYLNSVYQFVYQIASHYKGKIRYWITQNEINWPSIPMREF
ncbi:MAG: Ig-like domain-containing protein, partial [Chloroflexi bacterium]|nr:Ig-like domain-containing protein [Chloroflexota bacterium]